MGKDRITGRVNGTNYEVLSTAGDVLTQIPLDEAKDHSKLQKAIERNGWEKVE